jgi:hypothetical protein
MQDLTAEAGRAWKALIQPVIPAAAVEQRIVAPETEQRIIVMEGRFNPNHGVGGQFATAPGSGTATGHGPKAARKKKLLAQAAADRKRIRDLRRQLEQIEKQIHGHPHQAAKVTKKSVNAAKSAAAKKAAATKAAHGGGKGAQSGGGKTLQQQADAIRKQISGLEEQVKTLDAKAAKL